MLCSRVYSMAYIVGRYKNNKVEYNINGIAVRCEKKCVSDFTKTLFSLIPLNKGVPSIKTMKTL